MCGRFTLFAPGPDLADLFGLVEAPDVSPRYNIGWTRRRWGHTGRMG
jgi:hypothetical protein